MVRKENPADEREEGKAVTKVSSTKSGSWKGSYKVGQGKGKMGRIGGGMGNGPRKNPTKKRNEEGREGHISLISAMSEKT